MNCRHTFSLVSAVALMACSASTPAPEAPAAEPVASAPEAVTPTPEPPLAAEPTAEPEPTELEPEASEPEPTESSGKSLSDGETRTMKVIQKTILDHRDRFRACYDKVQAKVPELKGDLTLFFVLDASGKVKEAALNPQRSTIKNPEVVECAVMEVKDLKFPASSKGLETKVNYPFNFNPR